MVGARKVPVTINTPSEHYIALTSGMYDPVKMQMSRYLDPVTMFGIDLDTKDFQSYKNTIENCERFGYVIDRETTHGWHFKVYLPKGQTITLARSFEIRYWCGDDYHRLVRDMLKALKGYKIIDVLFDKKTLRRESILGYKPNVVDLGFKR